MAELVDAHDSKSCGVIHGSSILPPGTNYLSPIKWTHFLYKIPEKLEILALVISYVTLIIRVIKRSNHQTTINKGCMTGPKSIEQLQREHFEREERDDRRQKQFEAENRAYNERLLHRDEPTESYAQKECDRRGDHVD